VALTGSTNADLLQRVAEGAPEGLWLRADAQDGGRGRLGRSWDSPVGNLFASTIVRLRASDPAPSTLAFVAALATHDMIRQIAPHVTIQIKWPNDLLSADGAKLSGILLERTGDAIVVGIGVNLVWHPANINRKVSDLLSLGATPPNPQAAVEILADIFRNWLDIWRSSGLPAVIRQWEIYAHAMGNPLVANLPDGEQVHGLYAGLGEDGALQLRLADGRIRAIHAADVFLV
jgi:BirA family transcriptional regulator, biotin operon repressor / biotin---[acetyl-CoA-carboxylase] ligase